MAANICSVPQKKAENMYNSDLATLQMFAAMLHLLYVSKDVV